MALHALTWTIKSNTKNKKETKKKTEGEEYSWVLNNVGLRGADPMIICNHKFTYNFWLPKTIIAYYLLEVILIT